MDWHQIISFALIAIVVEVSPGPNFALIAKSVTSGGQSAALANIPGFAAAFLLHGTLSIFGVAAVLATSPGLLIVIQLVGALYLLYLGIQSFSVQKPPVKAAAEEAGICNLVASTGTGTQLVMVPQYTATKGFGDGFITNCLNPKISLFYYAVFPQVTAGTGDVVKTSFLLVLIHIVVNAAWFYTVTIALSRILQSSASSERLIQILRMGSGVALIGFSMFFAVDVAQAI